MLQLNVLRPLLESACRERLSQCCGHMEGIGLGAAGFAYVSI